MQQRTFGVLAVLVLTGVALAANTAGTLDTTFGSGGIVVTEMDPGGQILGLAIQSDGRVVAVGSDHLNGTANVQWAIHRYATDGTLDSTFGDGGRVHLFGDPGNHQALAVAIDASGRALVAGYAYENVSSGGKGKRGTTLVGGGTIARLTSSGALDTTFGDGGRVILPSVKEFWHLDVQADGKILAAGPAVVTVTTSGGKGKKGGSTASSEAFAIVRFASNGTVDTSFGVSGMIVDDILPPDESSAIRALGHQSTGKIVAVLRRTVDPDLPDEVVLTRYASGGTVDSSFGSSGEVLLDYAQPKLKAMAIDSSNRILMAGYRDDANGDNVVFVSRHSADGALDTTFGTAGVVEHLTANLGSSSRVTLAVQPDGKPCVGFTHPDLGGDQYDVSVLRYTTSGTLDTTFGTGGLSEPADAGDEDNVFVLGVDPSGCIIVGGTTAPFPDGTTPWQPEWLLARFLGD